MHPKKRKNKTNIPLLLVLLLFFFFLLVLLTQQELDDLKTTS
jgi:hypothetical protein